MSEMYLWQPQFTSNTCRPFTKNKDEKTLKKQVIQDVVIEAS